MNFRIVLPDGTGKTIEKMNKPFQIGTKIESGDIDEYPKLNGYTVYNVYYNGSGTLQILVGSEPKSNINNNSLSNNDVKMVTGLLTTAFEGGSNYWYKIVEHNKKDVPECEFLSQLLAHPKGMMTIADSLDEGNFEPVKLSHQDVIKGWEAFKEQYPKAYADVLSENDDAVTGDVFLQMVAFGKVIFG